MHVCIFPSTPELNTTCLLVILKVIITGIHDLFSHCNALFPEDNACSSDADLVLLHNRAESDDIRNSNMQYVSRVRYSFNLFVLGL